MAQTDFQPGDFCQEAPAAYGTCARPWESLAGIQRFMTNLELEFPTWFHSMDRLDPCASSTTDLHAALAQAPHPFLGGMLYGMLVVRTRVDGVAALNAARIDIDRPAQHALAHG